MLKRGSERLRRILIIGGVCGLVVAIGSVAWATTTANGKIVACAKKSGGALRLVGKAADCKNNERAVVWNVRGERGLRGAVGPSGPRGAAGPVGPAGAAGARGLAGPAGLAGARGSVGPPGWAGEHGAAGPPGSQGPLGSLLSPSGTTSSRTLRLDLARARLRHRTATPHRRVCRGR